VAYRLVDHTGDVAVDVEAATLDALFEEAAVAFADIVCDAATLRPGALEPLALSAPTPDLLLVAWLDELLFQFDARDRLVAASRVRITGDDAGGYRLEGAVAFDAFDPARHAIKVLIKAVTYHALAVEPCAGGWRARVVFDV
jgi:SHS2 domain-containing protein